MAELALKTNADASSTYDAGDILCAFNRRRIRCTYAQHLTAPKLAGLTAEGLRPAGSLARHAQEHTRQFRFDRLAKDVVQRTNLRTAEVDEISDKPNAKGEYMDVPMFLERRLKHDRHSIFGLKGQEFWFGGRTYTAHADLDKVWQEIETRTPERETSYTLWPAGSEELKVHLFIAVDEFDDAEAEALVESEYRDTGEFQEGMPGDEPTPIIEMVKKRKRQVEWEKLTGMDAARIKDVRDQSKTIDIRAEKTHDRAIIVKTKPTAVVIPEVIR